jgi:hypothetical protein
MAPKWTAKDAVRAAAEGWGFFDTDSQFYFHPELELEKVDDSAAFEYDDDAQLFVANQAAAGSKFHRRALHYLAEQCPDGFTEVALRYLAGNERADAWMDSGKRKF